MLRYDMHQQLPVVAGGASETLARCAFVRRLYAERWQCYELTPGGLHPCLPLSVSFSVLSLWYISPHAYSSWKLEQFVWNVNFGVFGLSASHHEFLIISTFDLFIPHDVRKHLLLLVDID